MKQAKYVITLMLLLIFTLASGSSFAEQKQFIRTYEVTITNLTRGQVFSPPILMSHNRHFRLFTLGTAASPYLYPLAEDADTDPLIEHIASRESVFDYALAEGPVVPGDSVTLEVRTRRHFRFISAAGMLVTTNDAFFAVPGFKVPPWGKANGYAEAYDAGSEANSEDCSFIPGPPCSNGGVRDIEDAEGYVHIHAGIHGIADLVPARDDWRNPVAKFKIRPVY